MADSTDNLGQVGEDTSALIKAADADRNARIREERQQRKEELKAGNSKHGGLERVAINAPHKAQYNGRTLALFIAPSDQIAGNVTAGLSLPWIKQKKNLDGTYYAWFGIADATFVTAPAAEIAGLDLKIEDPFGYTSTLRIGDTATPPKLKFLDSAGTYAELTSDGFYTADIGGQFTGIGPSAIGLGTSGAITVSGAGTFAPVDITYVGTDGVGHTIRLLGTTPSAAGNLDGYVNGLICAKLGGMSISGSVDCDSGTVTVALSTGC